MDSDIGIGSGSGIGFGFGSGSSFGEASYQWSDYFDYFTTQRCFAVSWEGLVQAGARSSL